VQALLGATQKGHKSPPPPKGPEANAWSPYMGHAPGELHALIGVLKDTLKDTSHNKSIDAAFKGLGRLAAEAIVGIGHLHELGPKRPNNRTPTQGAVSESRGNSTYAEDGAGNHRMPDMQQQLTEKHAGDSVGGNHYTPLGAMAFQVAQRAHLNSELTKLNEEAVRRRNLQLQAGARTNMVEEFVVKPRLDAADAKAGCREVALDGLSKPGVAYLQLTPTPSGEINASTIAAHVDVFLDTMARCNLFDRLGACSVEATNGIPKFQEQDAQAALPSYRTINPNR
jgi:hypothetical protein